MVPGTASDRRDEQNDMKFVSLTQSDGRMELGGYLGGFHLVIQDLKGKHQFLWQY